MPQDDFYKNLQEKKTTQEMVRDMHTFLIGNEYHEGLKNKFNKVEKRVEVVEKNQNKHSNYFKIIIGAGGVLGGILAFWHDIVSIFK